MIGNDMKSSSRFTLYGTAKRSPRVTEGTTNASVPGLVYEPNTSQTRSSTTTVGYVVLIILYTLGGGQSLKELNESLIWDQQLASWVKDKDRTRVDEITAQNIKEDEE
jgi:exonuclease III